MKFFDTPKFFYFQKIFLFFIFFQRYFPKIFKPKTEQKFLSKFLHLRQIIQQLKLKNTKIINSLSNNSSHPQTQKNLSAVTYISNNTQTSKTQKIAIIKKFLSHPKTYYKKIPKPPKNPANSPLTHELGGLWKIIKTPTIFEFFFDMKIIAHQKKFFVMKQISHRCKKYVTCKVYFTCQKYVTFKILYASKN